MKTKEDILNRKPLIDKILSILDSISESRKNALFAIDGEWGSGKSFVLNELEKRLEVGSSESSKYYVFHYNCWQYDYYEEPASAIVSVMLEKIYQDQHSDIENISRATLDVAKKTLKKIVFRLVENKTGINLAEVSEDYRKALESQEYDASSFDEWFSFRKTMEETRTVISSIAAEKTIVIVVDELDRCLPNYAIKVLERIYNIFYDIDNVIVIFAIDKIQLCSVVKNTYGIEKSELVDRFIKKYIDFSIKLDYGTVQDNVWNKYQDYFSRFSNIHFRTSDDDVKNIVLRLFKSLLLDIRNQEKMMEEARLFHKLSSTDEEMDYSVMLFEILVSIIVYVAPGYSFKILPEINMGSYKLEGRIGTELYNILKELENDTEGNRHLDGNITNGHIECSKPINLTYYYLYTLFSKIKKFAGDRIEGSDKELKVCRNFLAFRGLL